MIEFDIFRAFLNLSYFIRKYHGISLRLATGQHIVKLKNNRKGSCYENCGNEKKIGRPGGAVYLRLCRRRLLLRAGGARIFRLPRRQRPGPYPPVPAAAIITLI